MIGRVFNCLCQSLGLGPVPHVSVPCPCVRLQVREALTAKVRLRANVVPHSLVLPVLQCLQWNYNPLVSRKLHTMGGAKRHPRCERRPHPLWQDMPAVQLLRALNARLRTTPNRFALADLQLLVSPPGPDGRMDAAEARRGCDLLYNNGVLWVEEAVPRVLTEALVRLVDEKMQNKDGNQYFTVQYFKNREVPLSAHVSSFPFFPFKYSFLKSAPPNGRCVRGCMVRAVGRQQKPPRLP